MSGSAGAVVGTPAGLRGPRVGGAGKGARGAGRGRRGRGWDAESLFRAQPLGRWLFASFPKVASDKSIYLGQIVSEKLPLELPWTKPAV